MTQREGAEGGVESAGGRTDLRLRLLDELHQQLVGGPHLVGPDLVRSRLGDRKTATSSTTCATALALPLGFFARLRMAWTSELAMAPIGIRTVIACSKACSSPGTRLISPSSALPTAAASTSDSSSSLQWFTGETPRPFPALALNEWFLGIVSPRHARRTGRVGRGVGASTRARRHVLVLEFRLISLI